MWSCSSREKKHLRGCCFLYGKACSDIWNRICCFICPSALGEGSALLWPSWNSSTYIPEGENERLALDRRHLCQVDGGLLCLVFLALLPWQNQHLLWHSGDPPSQPGCSSFEVRTDSTILGSDSFISGTCCFSWWGLSVPFCKGGNHSVFSRGLLWEWRNSR